jgi:hypothetical protein
MLALMRWALPLALVCLTGAAPPPCGEADAPLRLRAALDDAPGEETVVASLGGGVLLLDANGRTLAAGPLGCADPQAGSAVRAIEIVRLRGRPEIALRVEEGGHCGRVRTFVLLERRGSTLAVVFQLDEAIEHQCGPAPRVSQRGRIEVSGDRLLRRLDDGPVETWRWRDDAFRRD